MKAVDEALSDENDIKECDVEYGTFAISNLCRGTPAPQISVVKTAIPTLFKVLRSEKADELFFYSEDEEKVLSAATWALASLSASHETFDLIFSCPNAVSALVNLLT